MARFRRKDKEQGGSESVDLSDDDHAWWANGRVQSAPGLGPEPAAEPEPDSTFKTDEPEPWLFSDVFAVDVDGAVGKDGDPRLVGDADEPKDTRSLAELFSEEAAYRSLGLDPGAGWDDIQLAHRRIAKRYHPDRLIHADEDARIEGERLMIDANAAYETLRQLHRPHTHTTGLFSR